MIDDAETIFRGRVVAYELHRNPLAPVAKLTFHVLETYRGQGVPAQNVFWGNSTFAYPKDLADFTARYGDDIVAGLGPMNGLERAKPKERRAIELWFPEALETPWVVQANCTPPFMDSFARLEALLRRRGVLD